MKFIISNNPEPNSNLLIARLCYRAPAYASDAIRPGAKIFNGILQWILHETLIGFESIDILDRKYQHLLINITPDKPLSDPFLDNGNVASLRFIQPLFELIVTKIANEVYSISLTINKQELRGLYPVHVRLSGY